MTRVRMTQVRGFKARGQGQGNGISVRLDVDFQISFVCVEG